MGYVFVVIGCRVSFKNFEILDFSNLPMYLFVLSYFFQGSDEENPRRKWKNQLDAALDSICKTKKKWLWLIFLVTASPGVLNGMHITSYVFFVDNNPPYCNIPALEKANWTAAMIKNISLPMYEYVIEVISIKTVAYS